MEDYVQNASPFMLQIFECHYQDKLITEEDLKAPHLINTYLLKDTSAITKVFSIFLRTTLTLAKKHVYDPIVEIIKYVLANKNKQNPMFMR